jgi:formamidopyrimidine-DNA glycosylase
MPELPEVETMRRGIAVVAGSRITDLWRPPSGLRPFKIEPPFSELREKIVGRSIAAVTRIGKRIVLELEHGNRLMIEPRMTGRVLLLNAQATRLADKHLRLVFELSGRADCRLLFWDSRGLGVVRLVSPDSFQRECARWGPDALTLSAELLQERLSGTRQAVKVALMDQKRVAGIGNLYASEILHRARLDPEARCDRLRCGDWRDLQAAVREVLEEAIRSQGSTLSDGMYRTAEDRDGGYQEHHRVYQRAGKPCLSCDRAKIVRIVQAQRSTFLCRRCQCRRRGKK